MRTLLANDPFHRRNPVTATSDGMIRTWPAMWIKAPFAVPTPAQVAFCCRFTIAEPTPTRLHVSADEHYQLFLDGQPLGRGPDYGDQENWYYDTYELLLTPGEHRLVARVLMLGDKHQGAQISLAHGLVVCPDPDSPLIPLLATGIAPWSCKLLPGYTIAGHGWALQATGPMILDTRQFPWGYETGEGTDWSAAVTLQEASVAAVVLGYFRSQHILRPAMIPSQIDRVIAGVTVRHVGALPTFEDDQQPFAADSDMADEHAGWRQGSTTIPPHTLLRRVLLAFDDYYSFYYRITVSGGHGARLRIAASERLCGPKGDGAAWTSKLLHDRSEGAFFNGPSDEFILDGGANRTLEPYWWRCGRYAQMVITTGDEPLTISGLAFHETRYPLEMESRYAVSDARWERILALCFRTLQECCHETFVDCPYYEQMQWVGDMRLQILCHYVATNDVRQVRKALSLINHSPGKGGYIRAFYPAELCTQIPGFALWYIACVHDLALWRGEKEFARSLMPQVRATMDAILQHTRPDGLITWPQGWPFTDWAEGFISGDPPAGEPRTESIFNFQTVHVLDMLAGLEEYLAENELAARWRRKAQSLAAACNLAFWDDARGLFAIDLAHRHFSEHSQCLAVLSGRITPQQQLSIADKLISDTTLTRVQLFYCHYLFEAYRKLGLTEALFTRMAPWHKMLELGLKTAPETDSLTRSDCHAWSAHPLFHFFSTILGIRPATMGFSTVEISPQLGPLKHASGKLVHPSGVIEVEFHHAAGAITGRITLPPGITGTATLNGRTVALHSGTQKI